MLDNGMKKDSDTYFSGQRLIEDCLWERYLGAAVAKILLAKFSENSTILRKLWSLRVGRSP